MQTFSQKCVQGNSMFEFLVLSLDSVNNANYLIKIQWLQSYKMVVSKKVDVLTVKDIATWTRKQYHPFLKVHVQRKG